MKQKSVTVDAKKKRVRSPNFPFLNLEEAVKRTKEFYDREDRHWANVEVASKHWGYSSAASGGALVIAALTSFGLLEDEGARQTRKVRVTESGLKIILDNRPASQDRFALLQKAALKPKLYAELWEKWNGALPSDQNIEYLLLSEMGFNRKAVSRFIEDFRHTLAFAGMIGGNKVLTSPDRPRKIELDFDIGDYVQWESQGVVQFEAKKVTGFSEDGSHAFVEGTSTGLPVEQLTKMDPPEESEKGGKPLLGGFGDFFGKGVADFSTKQKGQPQKPTMNQDVYTLPGGNGLVLQWPDSMTTDDLADVELWLEMMKRKLKRIVQKKDQDETK